MAAQLLVHNLKTGLGRKADLLHYMTKHGVAHWLPTTISADIEDEEDIDELIAKWSEDIDASKRKLVPTPSASLAACRAEQLW